MTNQELHRIKAGAAETVFGWIRDRGGILVWGSADLCDPSKSWTTPAKDKDGKASLKPSWQAQSTPTRHITDPTEVEVVAPKEVRRFHVATRIGASGVRVKLTDASGEKLRKALDKAGLESWHEFDYSTQEAIIFVPDRIIPLVEFVREAKAS